MESQPIVKEELTAWLSVLYASFEDRSGDVRKSSPDVILDFMKYLGYGMRVGLVKATERISVVFKNIVHSLTRQGVNFQQRKLLLIQLWKPSLLQGNMHFHLLRKKRRKSRHIKLLSRLSQHLVSPNPLPPRRRKKKLTLPLLARPTS